MAEFKFRLQKVWDFRQAVEDQAKKELQQAQRLVREAEDELTEILKKRQEMLRRNLTKLDERLAMQGYLDRLDMDRMTAESVINALKREEEAAHEHWKLRKQESEALTKLHDRKHSEHLLETSRAEQKELDDWTTSRHKRREEAA